MLKAPSKDGASFLRICSALLLLALQELVGYRCECCADEGTYDEYPEATHRCCIAGNGCNHCGTEASCGIDGGAGQTDAENVYEHQGEADDYAAEGAMSALLGGHAEDGQNEQEGQQDFYDETCHGAAAHACQTVCAEATGLVLNRAELEYECQQSGASQGTEALGNNVADEFVHLHAAAHEHAEGNGGIDVAAGNIAHAVCHADDGQTEGKGGEDVATAVDSVTADQHCGAAAEQHECERADEFGDVLFDGFHFCYLLKCFSSAECSAAFIITLFPEFVNKQARGKVHKIACPLLEKFTEGYAAVVQDVANAQKLPGELPKNFTSSNLVSDGIIMYNNR